MFYWASSINQLVAEYFMNADSMEVSFLRIKNDLQKHAEFASLSANSEIPGKEGLRVEEASFERNLSSLVMGKEEDVWF